MPPWRGPDRVPKRVDVPTSSLALASIVGEAAARRLVDQATDPSEPMEALRLLLETRAREVLGADPDQPRSRSAMKP
jgi:hypothetical protein